MYMEIKEILREKDLLKASAIFEIPIELLRRMNEQGLLNIDHIKAVVIRQDYLNYKRYITRNKKTGKYDDGEILVALVKEYNMNLLHIRNIVYKNFNGKMCFCKVCGQRISPAQANRTGGLCTRCNADSLPKF